MWKCRHRSQFGSEWKEQVVVMREEKCLPSIDTINERKVPVEKTLKPGETQEGPDRVRSRKAV